MQTEYKEKVNANIRKDELSDPCRTIQYAGEVSSIPSLVGTDGTKEYVGQQTILGVGDSQVRGIYGHTPRGTFKKEIGNVRGFTWRYGS